jgi:hypothetical protein
MNPLLLSALKITAATVLIVSLVLLAAFLLVLVLGFNR